MKNNIDDVKSFVKMSEDLKRFNDSITIGYKTARDLIKPMFSKQELKKFRTALQTSNGSLTLIKKLSTLIGEPAIAHTYTVYYDEVKRKFSKRFETPQLALEHLEAKIGEQELWNPTSVALWNNYEFFEYENGVEVNSYTY